MDKINEENPIINLDSTIETVTKDEITPQLCFCRKYRASNKSNYTFERTNLHSDVSSELGTFLKDNIIELKKMEEVKIPNDISESSYLIIQLEEIDKWESFEKNAFNLGKKGELKSLKKLKTHLNSFIIYHKTSNMLVGQIRKITPSNVLEKNGIMFNLFFDNNTFNKINTDATVRIDRYYDFLFLIEYENNEDDNEEKKIKTQIGIIKNYDNFCSIFDMNEQNEKEAKDVLTTCAIYNNFEDKIKVINLVKKDRTLQRMLLNPVCKSAFETIEPQDLLEIKKELDKKVKFNLDNSKISLSSDKKDEKESLRQFIKSVGHHYRRTIYGSHEIIEGTPSKIL